MIFTTVAAAILAAVTGMTTVRAPGGDEQQVSVQPNYVTEVTVARLVNGEDLFATNMDAGFGKKGPKLDLGRYTKAERSAFEKIASYMGEMLRDNRFVPTDVTIYRMYSLEEQAIRPYAFNTNIPEFTQYIFRDEFERSISFVDTKDNRLDEYELNDMVYHIDTNLSQGPSVNITGLFLDHLIGIGLDDLYWGRYYGMWSVIYDDSIIHTDTTTIDLDNMNQAMLGGFLGWLIDHDPILFYKIYYGWSVNPIFDSNVLEAHNTTIGDLAMLSVLECGNYDFAAIPMAGNYAHFALDRTDRVFGRTALTANAVNQGLAPLQAMSYNDLVTAGNADIID